MSRFAWTLCLLALHAGSTLAAGSLGGRVTDVEDSGRHIHPVDVDLLDINTGETLGLFSRNDPSDGSYLISNIPPGQYKLLFNAWGDANGYMDELYNDIYCDNGGCDRAGTGEVITIVDGHQTLDAELRLRGAIMGRITDADDPGRVVHPVDVYLLDPDTGAKLGYYTQNWDVDGSYEFGGIPTGDYKILFEAVGAASEYQDELYDGVACAGGNCDTAGGGTILSISNGVTELDIALKNNSTRAKQLAAIMVLLKSATGEDNAKPGLGEFYFNYDSDSGILGAGQLEDGSVVQLLGNVAEDGSVGGLGGLRLESPDDPGAAVTLTLDSKGRPDRISSAAGTVTYVYLAGGRARITVTDASGQSQSYVIDTPPPRSGLASASSSSGACDANTLDSLFGTKVKSGEIVFACDNAYVEDTTKLEPNSLFLSIQDDIGIPIELVTRTYPMRLNSTRPNNAPARSNHVYEYRAALPTRTPSLSEWQSCCTGIAEQLIDTFDLVQQGIEALDEARSKVQEAKGYLSCGLGLLAGAPTECLLLVYQYLFDGIIDEIRERLMESLPATNGGETTPLMCSEQAYDEQVESRLSISYLKDLNFKLTKDKVRNGSAFYTQSGDLTKATLPKLVIGPVPAQLRANDPLDGILAYHQGSEVEESNGELVVTKNGELSPLALEPGSTLTFRAFDQFFDRSRTNPFSRANRIASQHYQCGTYSWKVLRNGSPFQEQVQADSTNSFTTQPLLPGAYEVIVEIDNNALQGKGYTAARQFSNAGGGKVKNLPPATDSVKFRVYNNAPCAGVGDTLLGRWKVDYYSEDQGITSSYDDLRLETWDESRLNGRGTYYVNGRGYGMSWYLSTFYDDDGLPACAFKETGFWTASSIFNGLPRDPLVAPVSQFNIYTKHSVTDEQIKQFTYTRQ